MNTEYKKNKLSNSKYIKDTIYKYSNFKIPNVSNIKVISSKYIGSMVAEYNVIENNIEFSSYEPLMHCIEYVIEKEMIDRYSDTKFPTIVESIRSNSFNKISLLDENNIVISKHSILFPKIKTYKVEMNNAGIVRYMSDYSEYIQTENSIYFKNVLGYYNKGWDLKKSRLKIYVHYNDEINDFNDTHTFVYRVWISDYIYKNL